MEPNRFGDIAAFVSAAKAGSFTAAAASLGLTRSAVGKSIARLEARMAVRLLNRTTRKLSLTDEGWWHSIAGDRYWMTWTRWKVPWPSAAASPPVPCA